jgi:group I intron endonuclease
MSKSHFVYLLKDPDTEEIRYVGKTSNLEQRYKYHINTTIKSKTHLGNWLACLAKENLKPIQTILFKTQTNEEASILERLAIKFFKYQGLNLTNIKLGGDGGPLPDETKRKISIARKGKPCPEEIKKRISETWKKKQLFGEKHYNFGRKASLETRQKFSKLRRGKPLSEFHRRRISEGQKGKIVSDSCRKNISKALLGKPGHNSISIIDDLGNSFKSCTEAAKHYKLNLPTLTKHLHKGTPLPNCPRRFSRSA